MRVGSFFIKHFNKLLIYVSCINLEELSPSCMKIVKRNYQWMLVKQQLLMKEVVWRRIFASQCVKNVYSQHATMQPPESFFVSPKKGYQLQTMSRGVKALHLDPTWRVQFDPQDKTFI